MSFISNYVDKSVSASPVDLGVKYVTKEYLMDVYPNLVPNMKAPALWTLGQNGLGQLGNNLTTSVSTPVQTTAGGTNWKQFAGGGFYSAAIKLDGTLWVWGRNDYAQLGNNDSTLTEVHTPVQTSAGGTNWKQVACGSQHTAAIKTDGTLWTWGYNNAGQLGIGTNGLPYISNPTQVMVGTTDWLQVSCSLYNSAAIKTDGTLWTWGENSQGQLGIGASSGKLTPVQVMVGTNDWKIISCGQYSIHAMKTDGTLWSWGDNQYGQLGLNEPTSADKSTPVQVMVGTNDWKTIDAGPFSVATIKTDGTLWMWGDNTSGKLGDSSTTTKSSPVQTSAGGTNWKFVSCGYHHTAAIKTDGTLWTWGANVGVDYNKTTPVHNMVGTTNWKYIACGHYHNGIISEAEGY